MSSQPAQERASGKTAAEEEAAKAVEEGSEPIDLPSDDHDSTTLFRTPGFHRLKLEWKGEDREVLNGVQRVVEDRLVQTFADAYAVMYELFDMVRTPATSPNGEIIRDRLGFTVWKQTASGSWEEDWSRLGRKEREHFLFQITTRLFDWEQRAADAWGEAMFARGQWAERYGIEHDKLHSGTIKDREAVARKDAAEERYFAIFVTLFSRKADGIVKTMDRLVRMLRDSGSL